MPSGRSAPLGNAIRLEDGAERVSAACPLNHRSAPPPIRRRRRCRRRRAAALETCISSSARGNPVLRIGRSATWMRERLGSPCRRPRSPRLQAIRRNPEAIHVRPARLRRGDPAVAKGLNCFLDDVQIFFCAIAAAAALRCAGQRPLIDRLQRSASPSARRAGRPRRFRDGPPAHPRDRRQYRPSPPQRQLPNGRGGVGETPPWIPTPRGLRALRREQAVRNFLRRAQRSRNAARFGALRHPSQATSANVGAIAAPEMMTGQENCTEQSAGSLCFPSSCPWALRDERNAAARHAEGCCRFPRRPLVFSSIVREIAFPRFPRWSLREADIARARRPFAKPEASLRIADAAAIPPFGWANASPIPSQPHRPAFDVGA